MIHLNKQTKNLSTQQNCFLLKTFRFESKLTTGREILDWKIFVIQSILPELKSQIVQKMLILVICFDIQTHFCQKH